MILRLVIGLFTVLNLDIALANEALSPQDPASFSRPDVAVTTHLSLSYNVDFDNEILHGLAILDFKILENTEEIILDAKDLDLESVKTEDGNSLQYEIGNHVANIGSKLTVVLHKEAKCNETVQLHIKYKTSPNASALLWLKPQQTSGKTHPYLFSQCGSIHARSIVPCQDTPAVKFTYDSEVNAPEEFTVLMSALRSDVQSGKTTFRQPVPVPAYLLAIVVGVLEYRSLGPRTGVWSEKEKIEESAFEFADTEKYLRAAESFLGPYEWTKYELLVLPPSFPHGGMENPGLTFVTPTLLAGDRSLADVIVHEIVHSWTGNLVSIANFEHFWLKEAFTVFLERKIGASLISDAEAANRSRDFESLLGLQGLKEVVNDLGSDNPFTRLVVDLKGKHPDDSFSKIPYEKGSLFVRYLEDLLGGPAVFEEFVRSYITKFKYKSHDSNQLRDYMLEYFANNERIKEVDWDTWFYGTGMPPVIPNYDTSMTEVVKSLLERISQGSKPSAVDVQTFTPHQVVHLLQELVERPALSVDTLRTLGKEYGLESSRNYDILSRWLRLCIRSRDETRLDDVFKFVNSIGRLSYLRPIYRDLYAWEEVRERAIDNFLMNEPNMMHLTSYNVRKDLHLS